MNGVVGGVVQSATLLDHITQFADVLRCLDAFEEAFGFLVEHVESIPGTTDYRRQMLALVKNGKLDDVPLSAETFRGYLDLQPFDRLNRRIAAVNPAEIFPVSMMSYLPVLESFKLETLGDVQHFIDENSDDAYQLAISQLALTDLDILSSNTALQYLCLVYVLKHDGGRDGLKSLYDLINGESDANGKLADMMMEQAKTLRFMQ